MMAIDKDKINAYIELTKPRITTLVLVTATLGFFLGGKGIHSWSLLLWTLVGTALTCGGSATLNHYLERDADSRMLRTRNRPIPSGKIQAQDAMMFGTLLILSGVFLLYVKVNILTSFLSLLTAFLYVLVYTPMKRVSWWNTTIGAVPGAIPPLGGWAAATGHLSFEAGILFAILFLWQHPHFYSIAWMFKEDYIRGGFQMLPGLDPDGQRTVRHIIGFSLCLIPVSLLPWLTGLSGRIYGGGALILGLLLLCVGMLFMRDRTNASARQLLRASVVYLPILLLLIVTDVSF